MNTSRSSNIRWPDPKNHASWIRIWTFRLSLALGEMCTKLLKHGICLQMVQSLKRDTVNAANYIAYSPELGLVPDIYIRQKVAQTQIRNTANRLNKNYEMLLGSEANVPIKSVSFFPKNVVLIFLRIHFLREFLYNCNLFYRLFFQISLTFYVNYFEKKSNYKLFLHKRRCLIQAYQI
jgi:hypothetical protein